MLNFELTLDEANTVLASLGKQPFEAVASIINKLQQQAQPQLPALQAELEAKQAAEKAVEKAAA